MVRRGVEILTVEANLDFLGGPGTCFSGRFLKLRSSEMGFPAF